MAKQTVSLEFQGEDLQEVAQKMVEFLQMIGVIRSEKEDAGNGKPADPQ